MARASWGKAKREVIALKSDIQALLASGATVLEIYESLHRTGRITVGKSTFFRHVVPIRDAAQDTPGKPTGIELTPEILSWLATAPKLVSAAPPSSAPHDETPGSRPAAPATVPGQPQPAPPESVAGAPADPVPVRRLPPGAGVEPEIRKFHHYRSGEQNHWDDNQPVHNQGDDSK